MFKQVIDLKHCIAHLVKWPAEEKINITDSWQILERKQNAKLDKPLWCSTVFIYLSFPFLIFLNLSFFLSFLFFLFEQDHSCVESILLICLSSPLWGSRNPWTTRCCLRKCVVLWLSQSLHPSLPLSLFFPPFLKHSLLRLVILAARAKPEGWE